MEYLAHRVLTAILCCGAPLLGQVGLAPDVAGCVDSKSLPKLIKCRIDNCEKKDSDHAELTIFEDPNGEPVKAAVDGDSRSVMYECSTTVTPSTIVNQAAKTLRAAGFDVPFIYASDEGALTAHKGAFWLTVDAASNYYTLYEIRATPEDTDTVLDADSLAYALEHNGRVPIRAIQFSADTAQFAPGAEEALKEVAALLQHQPGLSLRIEGHTDASAPRPVRMALSSQRAVAVVNWLVAHGVRRSRRSAQGRGNEEPIGDNATEEGRAKNNRIDLVNITVGAGTRSLQ